MLFLFELRDSDGNDCTVYDFIVEADSLSEAIERAGEAFDELYPNSEPDGGFGSYHPCACEHDAGCSLRHGGNCECDGMDCPGHGGATFNGDDDTAKGYPTLEDCMVDCSRFHRQILVNKDGSIE